VNRLLRHLQRHPSTRRAFTVACLAVTLVAGAAACGGGGQKGDTGPAGANGSDGAAGSPGAPGSNGVSTGSITGVLTYQPNPAANPLPAALPASHVTVTDISITDSVVSTTTDATGSYTLGNIPAGIHSLTFSGNTFATLEVDGVSVLATKTTTVSRLLSATNPIALTPVAAVAPAGFNAPAALGVAVAGGTAPYTYAWVAAPANPTVVTLSSSTAAAPTFTTGSLAAVIASNKVMGLGQVSSFDSNDVQSFVADPRIGFLGVSAQQLSQMTYNFTVTVTDAVGFVRSATVAVPPATLAQGNGVVPLGEIVIANIPGNATAATLAAPNGSAAVLNEAATANPWFIPDVNGNYSITAGANVLQVNASAFTGATPSCTTCHPILPQFLQTNVAAKFSGWANSAHGNHFFKYMHYDGGGNLVWNTDANGVPVPAPTGNPTVNWSSPGSMTTLEFGLAGGEGTHYSASCIACHTTGYNSLAHNGGFDDAATLASWTFPNLTQILTSLTGATSVETVVNGSIVTTQYNQVAAAPNMTAWNAMPANAKILAGMQCESCHGPLGGHTTGATKIDGTTMVQPVQEFSVAACAVCHDKPTSHDRVLLWRQSKHANLAVALSEGGGNGKPSASCNRCHSAQGFVQYVKQLTGTLQTPGGTPIAGNYPGNLVDPSTSPLVDASYAYLQGLGITANGVEPQTCQTCHDPHTTLLRIAGDTPMLPGGFQVQGAGLGAICFVCHNSRNGARSDELNGVYTDNSNPGTPVSVSSIGAPHEANQGDVVAGRNAFFVGAYYPSPHLSIEDTCVGCHMKNFPAGLTGAGTNHTWKVDSTICASCHGGASDPVDGDGLQSQFDSALADLEAALSAVGQATVPNLYYKGSKSTVQITGVSSAVFVPGRSPGFVITFAAPVIDPNNGSGTILVLGSTGSPAGLGSFYADSAGTKPSFDLLKGTFAKANWNYELLTQDGSRGVHNPSFSFDVLSATVAAINNASLPK